MLKLSFYFCTLHRDIVREKVPSNKIKLCFLKSRLFEPKTKLAQSVGLAKTFLHKSRAVLYLQLI